MYIVIGVYSGILVLASIIASIIASYINIVAIVATIRHSTINSTLFVLRVYAHEITTNMDTKKIKCNVLLQCNVMAFRLTLHLIFLAACKTSFLVFFSASFLAFFSIFLYCF